MQLKLRSLVWQVACPLPPLLILLHVVLESVLRQWLSPIAQVAQALVLTVHCRVDYRLDLSLPPGLWMWALR